MGLFKQDPHLIHKVESQRLLDLIYATKASWDHAKETERAVYESHVDSELTERTKLQECKYMYLYKKARELKLHGQLNDGVIQH